MITTKRYHDTRAAAAKAAWAQRCGAVLYISADADAALPSTVIAGSEEGKIINEKVFGAFAEMWRRFGDGADGDGARRAKWFIKADDDTFMHLDNLLALLARYDRRGRAARLCCVCLCARCAEWGVFLFLLCVCARSDELHYIGRAGEWRGVAYCGGGAGYVLSRATLRAWAPHIAQCKRLPVGEDVSVGLCLRESLRVAPRWHAGFYHRAPTFFLNTALGRRDHPEGLSPRPVSFHSLTPDEMVAALLLWRWLSACVDFATQRVLSYLVYTVNEPPTAVWRDDAWPTSVATH